uniref:Uncharacterized protein n=1 Tax=Tanacetum cinerariifolium TaxID=118510 RepID=A0A6L2LMF2_TANCI|nr:hypothetical protein [Tanacetum cinerariifolium]
MSCKIWRKKSKLGCGLKLSISCNTSSIREVGVSFVIPAQAINSSQHDICSYLLYNQSLCLHREVFQISLIEFSACVDAGMSCMDANNRNNNLHFNKELQILGTLNVQLKIRTMAV